MNIKILCWNINMFNPPKIQLKKKIIDTINNKSNNVDFIFLIESSFEFINDLRKSKIINNFKVYNGFAMSHGGFIHLLYKKNYENNIELVQSELPALIIKFEDTYLVGCHLYPFAENEDRRIMELIEIRNKIPKNKEYIIIGDTNMREKEITKIIKYQLIDFNYYQNKKPTWYHGFFDKTKMQITARYDKILYSDNIRINDFELIGKNKFELLSDHLGILTTINLN